MKERVQLELVLALKLFHLALSLLEKIVAQDNSYAPKEDPSSWSALYPRKPHCHTRNIKKERSKRNKKERESL
jgi:hypothetical protein